MIHFVPAWYKGEEWKENEQFWYRKPAGAETDETIKQIQLFQRNDICDYEILLISHSPNFRHFLHRYGVFRAPYRSVFDSIQCIERKKQALFSFRNLKWPEGTGFIYSDFGITAVLDGEKYAQIEFGEYGNLIQVDMFRGGQMVRRNVYDDRGFISLTAIYENGEMKYEQYLNEKGIWKLCCFPDGNVAVNRKDNGYMIGERKIPFSKETYSSICDVISEVLSSYAATLDKKDIFCVAAHNNHMNLPGSVFPQERTVFTVFENRTDIQKYIKELSGCRYVIADSEDSYRALSEAGCRALSIPPYDTRMDKGISLQLNVQKILVPVDRLTEQEFEEVILAVIPYLQGNEKARVHLFTRDSSYDREDILLGKVRRILEAGGYPQGWAAKESGDRFEFLLDEDDRIPVLFTCEICPDELSVSKCVREQRVLVELSEVPDMFLQISCVSMGVPQILHRENRYMKDGENGRVSKGMDKLADDIGYYLDSLANFNDAVIASYEIGKTYSTKRLINKWKEVIETIG